MAHSALTVHVCSYMCKLSNWYGNLPFSCSHTKKGNRLAKALNFKKKIHDLSHAETYVQRRLRFHHDYLITPLLAGIQGVIT